MPTSKTIIPFNVVVFDSINNQNSYIKQHFPEAYDDLQEFIIDYIEEPSLTGILGKIHCYEYKDAGIIIANIISQYDRSYPIQKNILEKCLYEQVVKYAKEKDADICIPITPEGSFGDGWWEYVIPYATLVRIAKLAENVDVKTKIFK